MQSPRLYQSKSGSDSGMSRTSRRMEKTPSKTQLTYLCWYSQSVAVTKWKSGLVTSNNWECATTWWTCTWTWHRKTKKQLLYCPKVLLHRNCMHSMWGSYCMGQVCQIWVTNKYIGILGTGIPYRRILTSIYLHRQSMCFASYQYCQWILGCSMEENNSIYCVFLPLHQPSYNRLLVLKVVQSCTWKWVCPKSCCCGTEWTRESVLQTCI